MSNQYTIINQRSLNKLINREIELKMHSNI